MGAELSHEALRYLVNNTQFTAQEVHMLHRHFRRGCAVTSKKKKLRLGRNEFVQLFENTFPCAETTQFAQHAFRLFDQDHNGKVDFQEFVFMLDYLVKGSENDKLLMLFQLYDIDNTKLVSEDEAWEIIEDLKMLHSGFVPREASVSTSAITKTIFSKSKDDKLSLEDFYRISQDSKTMQVLLEGSAHALYQPFMYDAIQNDRKLS